jgi:hypothetical protein
MSRLVQTGKGIYFEGEGPGGADYFCGRCGRILAMNVLEGRIRDLWLTCPGCGWINGFDLDLGWARYVVTELRALKLSQERIEALLEEARQWQGSADEFFKRNPAVAGGVLHWLSRIDWVLVVALLTFFHDLYATDIRDPEPPRVEVTVQQPATPPPRMSDEDVRRLAAEVHRLQEEVVRAKPPPPPPRRSGTRQSKRR